MSILSKKCYVYPTLKTLGGVIYLTLVEFKNCKSHVTFPLSFVDISVLFKKSAMLAVSSVYFHDNYIFIIVCNS